jgi:hypothetical protein
VLIGDDEIEIHPVPGKRGKRLQVGLGKRSFLNEEFRAYEENIARERGRAVIRGVPVLGIRRIEGKALPVTLLGFGEKICESIGPGSEISYAERRRERCKVEENAASPAIQHAFLHGKWLLKLEVYWIIQGGATGLWTLFTFPVIEQHGVSYYM